MWVAAAALQTAHTPFDRPEWWRLLARHCALEPCIAVNRIGDEGLVWPLARDGTTATSLANFYSFASRPLAFPENALREYLPAIARDLRGRFARLLLTRIPDQDGTANAVSDALAQAGWSVTIEQDDTNHYLDLAGRDYKTYLGDRPGRLRTTLKRKASKLQTKVLCAVSDDDWRTYERIYAASWKPAEASQAFWREFSRQEANAGRLRFGMAYLDGKPVAAQIWTVEHGTAFIHKLAHLPKAEKRSPGSVLTAALMRHVIDDDNVDTVDFGTGDDGYKRDWMELERPRYRIEALDPKRASNWPALAKRALKARLVGAEKPRYRPANPADGAVMAATPAPQIEPVPPESDAIDAKLRAVLADILGLEADRVASFEADSGLFGHMPELDSQAVATLLTEIEDRFDVVIDDEDVDGEMLETYGGLRAFVLGKCDAAA